MDEENLERVLKECNKSAKIGYKIASAQEKNLERILAAAQEKVQRTITDINHSPYRATEEIEPLEKQLAEIRDAFYHLSFEVKEELQNLGKNLSKFSITLFGRTMAGKSTLMEILTEGDGASIGKGSQRTTRDVRKYTWEGLEITDVPGIGAFEGEDDEKIAFRAARSADLILFLLTDDAPQAAEAECFSRIYDTGKPIICIMNVKASMAENKSLKLTLRDVDKRFDKERLDKIRNQFLSFSERFGQRWDNIPFINVHLKSAYAALKTDDPERSGSFQVVSRIDNLKRQIVEQVRAKGKFYRIKTFIDTISNPMLGAMENLLEQSQINSGWGRTILAKRRQLEEWKRVFYHDAKNQIKSLIVKIKSELNGELASFAEDHFDDQNADKAWSRLLESRKVEVQCQELLENLEAKSNDKLREITREITNELKFSTLFERDKSLRMQEIVDEKRIWNWSTITLGGGLSIAAIMAPLLGASALAGPLFLAALAVSVIGGIGSYLLTSRNEKELEARKRLERKLKEKVRKICDTLEVQMKRNLDSLVSGKIEGKTTAMDRIYSVISHLADTQRDLTRKLNNRMLELNQQIMTEAIRLIGAEGLQYHMKSVARIPGNTSLILLNDGTVFPKEQKEALHSLMGNETIDFLYDSNDERVLISRILGGNIDRNRINIEEKIGVAHIPMKNAASNMKTRVRLAQQFVRLAMRNE